MAENKNRCWPGYAPVKGKRPNNQDSCRPKTESKRTDSEKESRAQRKRQLAKWQADHPGTHKPPQHLDAPGAKAKESNAKPANEALQQKETSRFEGQETEMTVEQPHAARWLLDIQALDLQPDVNAYPRGLCRSPSSHGCVANSGGRTNRLQVLCAAK